MPTYNVNGQIVTMTEQQAANLRAQGLFNVVQVQTAPDPNAGRTLGAKGTRTPTGMTPCQLYENAKRIGQSAAIVNALKAKCDAYQQAQAFAASPATMATTFQQGEGTMEVEAPGMSMGVKVAIGVGAVVLIGGLAWYLTRN